MRHCAAFGVAQPPLRRVGALAAGLALSLAGGVSAEEYFVDRFRGTVDGDGSWSSPWIDIERVLDEEAIAPGDTIWIGGGDWGVLTLDGLAFDAPGVLLTSLPPEIPVFDGIDIIGSRGLSLAIMEVLGGSTDRETLVTVDAGSSNISLEDFDIAGATSTEGWSREDWATRLPHGIRTQGADVRIGRTWITTIDHGVAAIGPRTVVEDTTITDFTGDGIRVLGDGSRIHGNEIANCLDVDSNHDDGIQSWSLGEGGTPGKGVVRDVTLSANVIIERREPFTPFPCALQGIGLFDGMFDGWVIENNVIAISAWHGITMMGATNGVVRYNTVMGVDGDGSGPPWISVTRHKDGRLSEGMRVTGNLIAASTVIPQEPFRPAQPGVTWSGNVFVDDPDAYFANAAALDFSLAAGSPAIDAGAAEPSPPTDIMDAARDAVPDLGAYEFR